MTATRKILLILFCTSVSAALAAQEAKDETSKSVDKAKTEQNNPVQPGQIPMIFRPAQGQNPWMFGGAPGGNRPGGMGGGFGGGR